MTLSPILLRAVLGKVFGVVWVVQSSSKARVDQRLRHRRLSCPFMTLARSVWGRGFRRRLVEEKKVLPAKGVDPKTKLYDAQFHFCVGGGWGWVGVGGGGWGWVGVGGGGWGWVGVGGGWGWGKVAGYLL